MIYGFGDVVETTRPLNAGTNPHCATGVPGQLSTLTSKEYCHYRSRGLVVNGASGQVSWGREISRQGRLLQTERRLRQGERA